MSCREPAWAWRPSTFCVSTQFAANAFSRTSAITSCGAVGWSATAGPFDGEQVAPGDLGAPGQHLSGEATSDGDALLGVALLVKPTDAAVGGQA